MIRFLRKGTESNLLEILVDHADLTPFSQLKGGLIEDGIILSFTKYNLDDVLLQLIEEYGEEELIKRIKLLD